MNDQPGAPGHIGPFTGVRWPDPAHDRSWMLAHDRFRVHGCRIDDLPEWADEELWRLELSGGVAATISTRPLAMAPATPPTPRAQPCWRWSSR